MSTLTKKEILNRYEQLKPLKFLEDRYSPHWTVDQARQVIRIVFQKKSRYINIRHSSYGIKHLLERLSSNFGTIPGYKYCSNQTVKEAMRLEGFVVAENKTPNHYYNISEAEYKSVDKIKCFD